MNIDVLLWFQSIRAPLLDALTLGVTQLGELPFLVAGICVIYWCADKRLARFIMLNLFVGGMLNALLKITFCVPRPWLLDARVVPVEAAVHAATGYSFPSGHTASAVAVYGALALWFGKPGRRWIWVLAALPVLLVAVSRMYLGVHTPADVLVSIALGAALLGATGRLLPLIERRDAASLCIGLALGVALALYAYTRPDAELTMDAFKTAGACCGLFIGWFVEARWVRFPTQAAPLGQLAKLLLGLALVGAVMLIGWPFALLEQRLAALVRYLVLALIAVVGWPTAFRFVRRRGVWS